MRRRENLIGGVCGGIAHEFGIDPTIVRFVFVMIALASCSLPIIPIYLVMWLLIPQG